MSSPGGRRSTPRPTSCWQGSTVCRPRRSWSFPAPRTWSWQPNEPVSSPRSPPGSAGDLAAGRPARAGRARPDRIREENADRLSTAFGHRDRRGGPRRARRRRGALSERRRRRIRRRTDHCVGRGGLDPCDDDRATAAESAEIVTVIAGEDAPIPLAESTPTFPTGRARGPRRRSAGLVVAARGAVTSLAVAAEGDRRALIAAPVRPRGHLHWRRR